MKRKVKDKQHLYRNKADKVNIVLNIVKKLTSFPASDLSRTINLYNDSYPAIVELKKVFNEYINSDLTSGMSGKIYFPEIKRNIQYMLPAKHYVQPIFVLSQQ